MAFEGCAYFLAGVEPGSVVGAPALDPAVVDDRLSKYVLHGHPRWTLQYTDLDGHRILVLIIEAPRAGDPICTLQRAYENARPGRIFVRRQGKTEEANAADIRALEARGQAVRPKVELSVVRADSGSVLCTVDMTDAQRDLWVQDERKRLLAPVEPSQHRALGPVEQALRSVSVSGGERDIRSKQKYLDEMRTYLDGARTMWFALMAREAISKGVATLELEIVNSTERNFENVEVLLDLPDGLFVWLEANEPLVHFNAPKPPKPWGTLGPFDQLGDYEMPKLPSFSNQVLRHGPRRTVQFLPRHLRPGERDPLPPVHLTVPDGHEPEQVAVRWRLTSTDADGSQQGELFYDVEPEGVAISIPDDPFGS
jgi:hypothetical protein